MIACSAYLGCLHPVLCFSCPLCTIWSHQGLPFASLLPSWSFSFSITSIDQWLTDQWIGCRLTLRERRLDLLSLDQFHHLPFHHGARPLARVLSCCRQISLIGQSCDWGSLSCCYSLLQLFPCFDLCRLVPVPDVQDAANISWAQPIGFQILSSPQSRYLGHHQRCLSHSELIGLVNSAFIDSSDRIIRCTSCRFGNPFGSLAFWHSSRCLICEEHD